MEPNFNIYELKTIEKVSQYVRSYKESKVTDGTIFVPLDYPLDLCFTPRCKMYMEDRGYMVSENFGGINVTF